MRRAFDYWRERGARHHWSVRAFKWLLLVSALAMAVSANTAQSDEGLTGSPPPTARRRQEEKEQEEKERAEADVSAEQQ